MYSDGRNTIPEASYSLAIESHIFCIWLGNTNMMTVLEKNPDGLCISVWITTSKTLISHIKEGKMTFNLKITWCLMSKEEGGQERKINEQKGKKVFTLNWCEISLHCSSDGSTPVGLWAQAWSRKNEPLGAFCEEDTCEYSIHIIKKAVNSNDPHYYSPMQ